MAVLLLFAGLLAGCHAVDHLNDPPRRLVLKVAHRTDAMTVARILRRRFDDWRVSVFSSMDVRVDGNKIVFIFRRGAPARTVVNFLVQHDGRINGRIGAREVLFRNRDPAQVNARQLGEGAVLDLTVSDRVGRRISHLSAESIGRFLNIRLDGRLLASAPIARALDQRFEIATGRGLRHTALIATILRYGPLPEKATIVRSNL